MSRGYAPRRVSMGTYKRSLSALLVLLLVLTTLPAAWVTARPLAEEQVLSEGKPASASSGQTTAQLANDGNGDTYWEASASPKFPQSWEVDLGSVATVTRIAFEGHLEKYVYRIETSPDDSGVFTQLIHQ